jgi:hypothetical protein
MLLPSYDMLDRACRQMMARLLGLAFCLLSSSQASSCNCSCGMKCNTNYTAASVRIGITGSLLAQYMSLCVTFLGGSFALCISGTQVRGPSSFPRLSSRPLTAILLAYVAHALLLESLGRCCLGIAMPQLRYCALCPGKYHRACSSVWVSFSCSA